MLRVILTCFLQNAIYFQIQGLYDAIMGRPCNFGIFQDRKYKFGKLGILIQIFQKVIYFQIQSFYDVSMYDVIIGIFNAL